MIINYLKAAWRSITKNKAYSFINIVGLSAGLTCFAFIFLWVNDELSFDKFNKNYARIVRLTETAKTETGINRSATTSAPMAKALKDDYPEVENTVRVDMHEEIVQHNGQQVLQSGILIADPSIFDVFSYGLSRGDVKTALKDPYTLVLTESAAKKYFGATNPIGQTLNMFLMDKDGRGADYKITGVMPDPPQNAHFTFNMIASFKTVEVAHPDVLTADGWGDASYYTYILLKPGVDYKAFNAKISQFYKRYIGKQFDTWRNIYSYSVQPLADIHLSSHLQYEIAPTADITQVYIFLSVGIFILLLAGINYTNLATARSAGRVKEVSIKKVVGAGQNQLIMQYLAESVFTALAALALSFALSVLLQPYFFRLTGKDISLFNFTLMLGFLVAVTVFMGVLSGIYPADILSGIKPAHVLKGKIK